MMATSLDPMPHPPYGRDALLPGLSPVTEPAPRRPLAIGTAQFAQPYGIADDGGPPDPEEVAAILAAARKEGVNLIDTAPRYGPCEVILGSVQDGVEGFRVVTKTAGIVSEDEIEDPLVGVAATLRRSLRALGRDRVQGLLIHHPDDALAPHGRALVAALLRLRDAGLAEKIGLSVYEPDDLDAFRDLDAIDLVQLPLNVLDQRMIRGGWLARLKDRGIEVHARSAFMQGLLCMEPARVGPALVRAIPTLQRFHAARTEAGLSAPAACLAYLAGVEGVDAVIVGVKSAAQFHEVVASSSARWDTDFSTFARADKAIVDPRRWQS